MKMLNSEITNLLDRLYNLRGDDSIVLVSMEKERNLAVETKERTSSLKTELQSKINDLTSEENVLVKEGEKLVEVLGTINKAEFANVINHLNINFDPEAIRAEVEHTLPATLERVAIEKENAGKELVKVEDEMNEAITKIEELGIRRDEALSNQERLNRYFDLALSSNINITRDEITSLLAKFDFTEEEQREAAKLLMFPEDGLFEYENNRQDKPISGKSISEVIQEAKDIPIVELNEVKDEPIKSIDLEPIHESNIIDINPSVEIPVVDFSLDMAVNKKDELISLLTRLGFDYLDFTNNDFEKILSNYNPKVLEKNVDIIERLKINKDVFNDNVELFYDPELESKIIKLTNVGKLPQDIYLNPNVLIKYNLNELENAINVLNESGLDPKNVPLMAY